MSGRSSPIGLRAVTHGKRGLVGLTGFATSLSTSFVLGVTLREAAGRVALSVQERTGNAAAERGFHIVYDDRLSDSRTKFDQSVSSAGQAVPAGFDPYAVTTRIGRQSLAYVTVAVQFVGLPLTARVRNAIFRKSAFSAFFVRPRAFE